jgi:FKBP-type peptidyl-prolyl cis-trans isomerase FkpA
MQLSAFTYMLSLNSLLIYSERFMKYSFFLGMFFSAMACAQTQSTLSNSASQTPADASTASAPQAAAPAPLHITKLGIIDTLIGTGEEATNGSIVEVHYTGWLYNHKALNLHGAKFDSSRDAGTPLSIQLGMRQVIRGWDMGLLGMKVGGKRTLLIPAYLGYSTQGSGNIPPNSHLVFDVELVSVKK